MSLLLILMFSFQAEAARYFAQVDDNGEVLQVIVAEPEFISSQKGTWVETFMDGGQKKNYASRGYKYDKEKEAFIAPKPHDSWVLDEATAKWKAPKARPADDGKVRVWDEATKDWKVIIVPERLKSKDGKEANGPN